MEIFLEVLNSCFTSDQIRLLRIALKAKIKVSFYGTGLGKSLLTDVLVNAGFEADEPGLQGPCLHGSLGVRDEEGIIAFCVKNTPKERIPNIYEILLGCSEEIANWVNQ